MVISKKISAIDTDPRIGEIRNEVMQHTDAIPYMLLPVRIETKFRTVKLTPALTVQQVESIIEALGEIHLTVVEVITRINAVKIRLVINRLGDVTSDIRSVHQMQVKEKGWIKQVYHALKSDLTAMHTRIAPSFPPEARRLLIVTREFEQALEQAPATKDKKDATGLWLEEMSSQSSAYALLGGPVTKIPFINLKNKKDLYIYIERRFQSLIDFFTRAKEETSRLTHIDRNQVASAKKYSGEIRAINGGVQANIATIHPDPSWQQFVSEKVNSYTNQITEKLKTLDTETIPFLESLPPPPPVESGDLIVHGVLTLVKLKKFNFSSAGGYEQQRRFRKYLQPRIGLLQKALTHKVTESHSGHIERIQRMYGALGESLHETSNKISAFQSTNKSQTFGNTVAKRFLSEKVSPVIDALKGQAIPGLFPGPVIIPKEPETEYQLCIRIYPDDIMIMTHDPALTEDEISAGKQFWKSWWAASFDKHMEKAAWTLLCTVYGTSRASWIARTMRPDITNPVNKSAFDKRPSEKITDIIKLIQGNLDLLKKLPDTTALKLFSSTATVNTFNSVLVNLNKSISLLKTLTREQSFLIDNLSSLNIQVSSQLNALIEKSHTLTADEITQCTGALSELENILLRTAEQNKLTASLIKTDPSDFTTSLTDPFIYPQPEIKPKDFNLQPYCGAMPDRFVAVTMNNGVYRHIRVGNAVTPNLPVGIDPRQAENGTAYKTDENGNLLLPENIQWMFSYDKAVEEGLGITIKLTKEQYELGFDKVIVIGTSNHDANTCKAELENLFTNHIYSEDGLEFLKTGTPTNNTEQRKSGYGAEDADERYRIEVEQPVNPTVNTDGKRLSNALGLDEAIVRFINHSDNTEINKAISMNRALFNGTIGHYMEEMFDTIFTYDNIRRTEKLFIDHCLGRGYLPSLRAGAQPYGILPTTSFRWLQMDASLRPLKVSEMNSPVLPLSELSIRLQRRFEFRIHQLLMILYSEYRRLADQHVIRYDNLNQNGADVSDRFTQMLCLHPVSMNYFFRQSINIARGPNATDAGFSTNYRAEDTFGPNGLFEKFKLHMFPGVNYPSHFFYDEASPDPVKSVQTDKTFSRIKEQFISSRNFGNRALDITSPVSGETVTEEVSYTDPLEKNVPEGSNNINYIEWILSRNAEQLLGGNALNDPARIPNKSLLFLLLRQSLLQAYQEAALEIMQKEKFFREYERKMLGSRYMYHFKTFNPVTKKYKNVYVTKWHCLFKHFDTLPEILRDSSLSANPFFGFINAGRKSMARYLDQVRSPVSSWQLFSSTHKVHFEKLRTVREAIASLSQLPTAELELLLGEHIDVSTHRLDSWLLSLVNQRLSLQRNSSPKGIFLGTYGYLENLRRDTNRKEYDQPIHADFKIPATEKVYHDADNQGFIHAPSIGQAITAAVMRSAYMGNISGEDERNRLSVNLSSSRIRMALKLIEGMNNNQSVNALLGFQFEKGLHERYREAEMDKFIQPLRKRYPLKQKVEDTAQDQAAYESLVIDGLALLEQCQEQVNWEELKDIKTLGELLTANFPAELDNLINNLVSSASVRAASKKIIIEEIDRMADAFDALGDLTLSESVYQIVQGNHVRAAAVLDALAKGRNIPEPQVIDTLRSGIVVTHRLLLQLPTHVPGTVNTFVAPAGWPATPTLLSETEPSLNSYLGQTFGPALNYKCLLTITDINNNSTQESFSLDELNLQPMDIWSLTGGMEELTAIIIHKKVATADPGTKVQADLMNTGPSGTIDDQPVARLFYITGKISAILSNARHAGANDTLMPDSITDHNNEGNHNVTELEQRVIKAFNALQLLVTEITSEVYVKDVLDGKTAPDKVFLTDTDYTNMLSNLDRALQIGVSNAYGSGLIIESTGNAHHYTVHQQLMLVIKELMSRLTSSLTLKSQISSITKPSLKIQKLQELAKTVLGRNKLVLPVYQLSNTAAISQQLVLDPGQKITRHGGRLATEKWMQGLSKVRPSVNHLTGILRWKDMMGHDSVSMQPVQLPFTVNDYWLGIEYPENHKPSGDKLSVMMINPELTTSQNWNSGIVLDEWVEIIPVKEETSGIVFHYNQPNATPPQSVLLAVTPSLTNRWEWDDLVHTVSDTFELARIRAVEPDHINNSYLSLALHAITGEIPPPQVEGEDPNALGVQAVMDFSVITKTEA